MSGRKETTPKPPGITKPDPPPVSPKAGGKSVITVSLDGSKLKGLVDLCQKLVNAVKNLEDRVMALEAKNG